MSADVAGPAPGTGAGRLATGEPQEPPGGEIDVELVGERIEALLTASAAHGALVRERSEELVRLVVDLYGAGLERMLDILHDAGRLDAPALQALAGDRLVSSLLLIHGLHPQDVRSRVLQALDDVRPYLGSHGGDVELAGLDEDGVVRLRLLGSCDGCSASSQTLASAVRGAIEAAAPEVTDISVEEPAPKVGAGTVIPVGALRSRLHDPPGPCPVPEVG